MKYYYLITNGEVTEADAYTEYDGIESILVVAESEAQALELADQYDRGEIECGNYWDTDRQMAVSCLYDN